jgi:glycosyltransferase involved in cell wall biosynthesis
MNVWLLKDGENLPVQAGARRMRTWLLAEELARRGHRVTWWSSTHSHQRKSLVFDADREVDVAPGFRLKLLHAGAYRRNVSLARLAHHARLAAKFRRAAPREPRPDAIVAAFPTIELAHAAVTHARARRVPAIVDIRDPWPDAILDRLPQALRPPGRLALLPMQARARACMRGSSSLVAVSQGFLDWGLGKAGMARRPSDRVFYLGNPGREAGATRSPRIAQLANRIEGKIVACFVGSFGHVYELGLVCDAAREMAHRRTERVHFVIAGDGEQAARVAAAARDLPNVDAPGWLSADEADDLMRMSHVGLAPIRQNPGCVPNKISEYAAAGLPILSSLEGETADLLARHSAGLTYAPGDRAGFLQMLERLAGQEELRRELSGNAHAMFEREFQASHVYGEYARHVESVVRSAAG